MRSISLRADAVKLGYATDVNGDPVVLDDQVIEIYPQDIVVPWNCVDGLLNVCRFVDDELTHIYGLDPISTIALSLMI